MQLVTRQLYVLLDVDHRAAQFEHLLPTLTSPCALQCPRDHCSYIQRNMGTSLNLVPIFVSPVRSNNLQQTLRNEPACAVEVFCLDRGEIARGSVRTASERKLFQPVLARGMARA